MLHVGTHGRPLALQEVATPGDSVSRQDSVSWQKRPELLDVAATRGVASALVKEELIPTAPVFMELLGNPGLRRGSTVVVHGVLGAGTTSFALALLSGATRAGIWCAAVNLPELGLVAADELGVALDHLVLVPSPQQGLTTVIATLLEGCGVVLAAWPGTAASAEVRRLISRARERRCALVILIPPKAVSRSPLQYWPETPDIDVLLTPGRFTGIGRGSGRITGRLVEVTATRRRANPREIQSQLWLPSAKGGIDRVDRDFLLPPLDLEERAASAWG